MQALIERIRAEGENIGRGIIKVDGFINHQIDPALTMEMGKAFACRFTEAGVEGVTRVITAEVSGIAPAVATGLTLGVPVIYARKHRPITMPDGFFLAEAPSPTKGGVVRLMVSPQYLSADDRVLLIDDFLATGLTIEALVNLIEQSGATLLGIGCVIEKVYAKGRERLEKFGAPVISLAKIDLCEGDEFRVF
ncbi:MAG TPA: xanthine phosphoribosyltransferase [Candidatus Sulfomarinibacteraceae bacterium]|nr:xanthine phosphoribosyltransferase [Candidatus Sulfomarinibacteraceae bacterium]